MGHSPADTLTVRQYPLVSRRSDVLLAGRTLARDYPAEIRATLGDPETLKDFADAVKKGIKRGNRTELNLYAQMMKLVGAGDDALQMLYQAFGLTKQALELAVEVHKNAAPMVEDKGSMVEAAERMLMDVYREDPKACYRSPLRAVLLRSVEAK